MLRGKFYDLLKDFKGAVEQFGKSRDIYLRDFAPELRENQVLGNIEFRLGWAYIRSRSDVEKGIYLLKEATHTLRDNVDLKVKLAQILF
mmetsp:Transcript_34637/g.52980  ORF Transcript_34637/g.52980 Transcript_34637/m.52980 type:complete len:89 (+) Transcript_34637:2038-2304(+)